MYFTEEELMNSLFHVQRVARKRPVGRAGNLGSGGGV